MKAFGASKAYQRSKLWAALRRLPHRQAVPIHVMLYLSTLYIDTRLGASFRGIPPDLRPAKWATGFRELKFPRFEQLKVLRWVYGYSTVQSGTMKLGSAFSLQNIWRRRMHWLLLRRNGVSLTLRRRHNVPEPVWQRPIGSYSGKVSRTCDGHALQSQGRERPGTSGLDFPRIVLCHAVHIRRPIAICGHRAGY